MEQECYDLLTSMQAGDPTSEQAIRDLLIYVEANLHSGLPADYLDFLKFSNGIEGKVGEKGYLILWSAEILPEVNNGYEVSEWMPGFFIIGSDGGDTAYGIDTRSKGAE